MAARKSMLAKKLASVQKTMRRVRIHVPDKRSTAIALVVFGVIALFAATRTSKPSDFAPASARVNNEAPAGANAQPAANVTTSESFKAAPEITEETGPKAPAPVTITGCLAQNDNSFRLKDTSGTDAPKSRSWKSGFLKKSPASIAVVDSSNRLKLTSYVGRRVSVTGRLVDREMQARELHRVAASCS